MPAFSIWRAQLGDLDRLLVALAQLLLDLAQLLAQDVLALLRGQRLLGLLADLLRQLEHLDALRQQRQHLVEALLDVEGLQHVLLFRRLGTSMMPAMKSASADGESRFSIAAAISGGHVRQQLHRLARALPQQVDARFDLRGQHLGGADLLDARHQERIARRNSSTRKRRTPLADHMVRAVGRR